MKKSKIIILNQLVEAYPQFKEISLVYSVISKVLNCSLEKAKVIAKTHCNLLSFWFILKVTARFDGSYHDFYKWMLEENNCNDKGYFKGDENGNDNKHNILRDLKIEDVTLEKFSDFEDVLNPLRLNPDKFYQIKIKADTSGFHFMTAYVFENELYISDTSYRGIGVKALEFITIDNFLWLKEY